MKPKFKRGDHIIVNGLYPSIIKDVIVGLDGVIWYTISWKDGSGDTNIQTSIIDPNSILDIKKIRNDKLSKILNK